jgi:hypothetical protein
MRKFTLIAAAAVAFAVLPFGAAAATRAASDSTPNTQPRTHWFAGAVTAVGSSSLSVDVLWTGPKDGQLNGTTVTVAVTPTTVITGKDQAPEQLSDIIPGDLVGLRATSADATLSSLTATHIHVWCNCHYVGGTLSSVSTTSIGVQVARTGPYDTVLKDTTVTIQVNAATTYIQGKAKTPITLGDLKVGDHVGVIFAANGFFKAPGFNASTATFTAKQVHDWQKQAAPATTAGAATVTAP